MNIVSGMEVNLENFHFNTVQPGHLEHSRTCLFQE